MISVVIPVYNEEKNLRLLHQELTRALVPPGNYEIIYVDDCSTDAGFQVLSNLKTSDPRIKVVQFARHFGQTEAMQAGVDRASGDVIVFLDADLQNDPQDIPKLLSKIQEGFSVVSGWRKKRKDAFFSRRLPSYLANELISRISKVKLHDFGCSLKAYRKEAITQVRLYSEMHRLIPIYVARQGAPIAEVEVSHRRRAAGYSHYSMMRVFNVILDFLVAEFISNYFNKPMYVFGAGGISCMLFGGGIGIFIIIRKMFWGGVWVSPLLFIVIISIVVGFQFILMGFIAELLIRLYYENTKSKTYCVKKEL